ncbi:MAG: type II secretion system protein [Firmicutes bacterium]|nr:type II secretion system protein [Bacillota bacterium]
MKKNRGFTLIELLAVIVILAVIALIATPLIMGTITKSKMNAFRDSVYGIIHAGEIAATEKMTNNVMFEVKNAKIVDEEGNPLQYKGQEMKEGILSFSNQGESSLVLWNGSYCGLKSKKNSKVTIKKASQLKDCVPIYDVGQDITLSDGTTWKVIRSNEENPLEVELLSTKNLKKLENGTYEQDKLDTALNSSNALAFDPNGRRTPLNGNAYCVNSASLGCNEYEMNGTTVTMDSAIKEVVTEYQKQLINQGSISSKSKVSLITKEQLETLGCDSRADGNTGNCSNAPSWVKGTSYWTRSKEGSNAVDVWVLYTNGDLSYDCASRGTTYGIRPTVTLPIVMFGGIDSIP